MAQGDREALDLGMAILSGRLARPFAARAERARELLVPILGEDPPIVPAFPPELPREGFPRLVKGSDRAEAQAVGVAGMKAFFAADAPTLRRLSAETLWVLWPTGPIGHHPSAELLSVLEDSGRDPVRFTLHRIRSYSSEDLRATHPRGLPESFAHMFDLGQGLLVTAEIRFDGRPLSRLMVVVHRRRKEWKIRSFPLPALDAAYVASKRTRFDEDPIAFVGEQVVRRVVLGQHLSLEADRHLTNERLWVRQDLVPREQLYTTVAQGPHRLGVIDTVFCGTRVEDVARMKKALGASLADKVLASAKELFRRPLEKLDACLTSTQLGDVHPMSQEVQLGAVAHCWVVRVEDEGGHERRVVAGLFI